MKGDGVNDRIIEPPDPKKISANLCVRCAENLDLCFPQARIGVLRQRKTLFIVIRVIDRKDQFPDVVEQTGRERVFNRLFLGGRYLRRFDVPSAQVNMLWFQKKSKSKEGGEVVFFQLAKDSDHQNQGAREHRGPK